MDSYQHEMSRPRRQGIRPVEFGLVATVAGILTLLAYLVFPVWDDGYLMLFVSENGDIFNVHRDRPIIGACWHWLYERGWLLAVGYPVHWLLWCGYGLLALSLWKRLFPALQRYAVLAALLTMTPLLCTIHLAVVNPPSGFISPVLTYSAWLVAAAFLRTPPGSGTTVQAVRCLGAVLLLLAAALLSDYMVPAGVACGVLLLLYREPHTGRDPAHVRAAALWFATVVAGYLAYWYLGSAEARSNVRPEVALGSGDLLYRAKVTTIRVINGLWQGSLGYLLARIGQIKIQPDYVGIALLGPSVLMASIAAWVVSDKDEGDAAADTHVRRGLRNEWALFLALAAGLAPMVFMRDLTIDGRGSRYWLPLLPLTSCLSLRIILAIVNRKARWLVGLTVGFLAGYFTATMGYEAITDRQRVERWGKQMEQHVSDTGLTLAILTFDELDTIPSQMPFVAPSTGADYWLTAILTSDWDVDTSSRFWAISNAHHEFHGSLKASVSGIQRSLAVRSPSIDRNVRGLRRFGPIARVLWIRILRDGTMEVEMIRSVP